MKFHELFFLAILLGFMIFVAWNVLRKRKRAAVRAEAKLMLVAVRRRHSGLSRVMELPADGEVQLLKSLENQWRIVNSRWLAYSRPQQCFISDANGLPAPGDEDWRMLHFYEIDDYDQFRDCVKILESEAYALLRHHLEIRMLCGEAIQDITGKLQRIF